MKKKKLAVLSWVIALALIFSNFIGMDPIQFVNAATNSISNGDVLNEEISSTQTEDGPIVLEAVSGVTLDKDALTLSIGEISTLVPTITPDNANNKIVTWSSDNPAIATVTEGLVTGVGEGTATITVTTEDGGKTALCVVTVTAHAPPVSKTFDLIGITDFHGQLLNSSNILHIGAALVKEVKDIKATNPNRTLIIGGGDLYQGTPVSNVLHGVPVQQAFSNMGMEVTALGNHEFDWGLGVINNETMIGASYAIVSANLYNKTTGVRVYEPYKVFTKDGVRIAVIGAITEESPSIILPAYVADFEFRDVATEINAAAKQIRDNNEADLVLASIHEGGSQLPVIVSELKGVDAVFGGHSHTILNQLYPDLDGKNIPVVIANSAGKGYIDLKMTVAADNTVTFDNLASSYKGLAVDAKTPLDSDVKAIVDKAYAALAETFNEVIGNDDVAYTKDQLDSPYGESQLGNWMADVVKNYANADVGMVNNGGIRLSPIPAGDITVGTIFNLMPFDNTVTTVRMSGAQLKYILEQAVQDGGKGIQISGVKFVYDSIKQSGQRVQSITRESNGTVVNDTDMLVVAAPDFVATGGDNFTGFLVPEIKATYVDSHYTVRDALMADVRAKGKITVVMNNRVDNQTAIVTPVAMGIAEARTTSLKAVILTGTVSAVNGNTVFMQDDTAGICVYNSGGNVFSTKKGDKIRVTGNLSVYRGLLEVTPASAADVVLISSGNVVAPKVVTVAQISDALQGQLIQVKDVTFTSIDNSAASIAQDSTGSIVVYKMPVVSGLAAGDTANVTAAVTRFDATLQLAVDSAADVVKTGTTPVSQGAIISVVATSDVHGNVLNFDYGTNAAPSKAQGLAKVSTYVKDLRAANPNVMLIDNGDTIQGTPLVYYYNMIDKTTVYPMAAVMGAMEYDSWTLGNHEFNYGLETLNRIMNDAKTRGIDILSANTYKADGTNFVKPYTMKAFNINGKTVTVAVIGLTTKTVPSWEDPAHYEGLHFNDLVNEAKKWIPIVRDNGADVVIVAAHSGMEGAADVIPENQVKALATQVSGIDAIIAGHAHSTINDLNFKNPEGKVVPIIEPGKWANNISQIDIAVDVYGKVTGLTTKNVAMINTIAEDTEIVSLIAPYQTKTLEYTATVLGQSTGEYRGDKQLTEPTEIMELINKVQAGAAGTQLSIAAPLSLKAYIPKGDITIKDIMGVYVYENFLYGVEMTGKQIKDWMEYTARYYKQVSNAADPIVKDPALNIADYNLDQLYGLTYDIDLTVPAATVDASGRVVSGDRIKNLKFNGKLIKDTDVFTVAINNYRYNGGGGFMAAAGISNLDPSIVTYDSAKALGDDGQVRSLMMKYVQDNKTITPSSTNNWKISTSPVVQEVAVTGVILNSAKLDIRIGNSQTLKATVLPQNATNKEVVWKSSDENVATVVNGVVTGLRKGTATITATTVDGNYSAQAIANVAASASASGGGTITNYTIIASTGTGGSITPSGSVTVVKNSSKTFTIKALDGYVISDVKVDGASIGVVSSYTFSAVSANHSIKAAFILKEQNTFTDVASGSWYYNAVKFASEKGLMNGTKENSFSPGSSMTRAMFVTVLYRMSGDTGNYANSFTDVHSEAWYERAASWASAKGIVGGMGDGTFSPNTPVTREQLVVMLYNYAKYKGLDVTVGQSTNIRAYNDALSISDYAYTAIQWTSGAKIINGNINGELNPKKFASRAEVSVILQRFFENVAQ